MAKLAPSFARQFFDDSGNPLAGGKVYTFVAGTNTPLATYTDQTEETAHPNPIILDAAGRASIWVSDAYYKFAIYDSDDVLIRTEDGATAASDVSAEATAARDAAIAAQEAAETAQGLAESARDAAQTAETNAETAETNAETAQGLAEAARDAALTAQTNAETAETNAETAQGLAEAAKGTAENAALAAVMAQDAAEDARDAAQVAQAAAETAAAGAYGLAEFANDAAYEVAHGAGEAGDVYYNTTLNKVRVFTNAWRSLGGGGGGGSIQWTADLNAPLAKIENAQQVFEFGPGSEQSLFTLFRVPNSYSSGSPISLNLLMYSPSSSGDINLKTIATLIRPATDAITSTTNQRTSTNAVITTGAGTVDKPQAINCDLTDNDGQINTVDVSAGDLILIQLTRLASGDTSAEVANVLPYSAEVVAA